MRTFTVRVPEVHYSYVVVEAENEADAIQIAMKGDDVYEDDGGRSEYAYTLDDADKYDALEH